MRVNSAALSCCPHGVGVGRRRQGSGVGMATLAVGSPVSSMVISGNIAILTFTDSREHGPCSEVTALPRPVHSVGWSIVA